MLPCSHRGSKFPAELSRCLTHARLTRGRSEVRGKGVLERSKAPLMTCAGLCLLRVSSAGAVRLGQSRRWDEAGVDTSRRGQTRRRRDSDNELLLSPIIIVALSLQTPSFAAAAAAANATTGVTQPHRRKQPVTVTIVKHNRQADKHSASPPHPAETVNRCSHERRVPSVATDPSPPPSPDEATQHRAVVMATLLSASRESWPAR